MADGDEPPRQLPAPAGTPGPSTQVDPGGWSGGTWGATGGTWGEAWGGSQECWGVSWGAMGEPREAGVGVRGAMEDSRELGGLGRELWGGMGGAWGGQGSPGVHGDLWGTRGGGEVWG